ncbi:hypothetical protein MTR_3g034255 [Medicago truncatula]|uniref:Nodule Cysteine-Rich (NCR) secreted peptide n=1 Tax=Medicago truncatula TaxID=3880 RepID=G7IZJ3_MEDTR|nr:hypothetical protein MTR_3g034255 [Medicago truncatula]
MGICYCFLFLTYFHVISLPCRSNADCPPHMCKTGWPKCDQTHKDCWCFLPPSVHNNIPNVILQITN